MILPDPAEKIRNVADQNHVCNRPYPDEPPVEYDHYYQQDDVEQKLPVPEFPTDAPGDYAVLKCVGISAPADFQKEREEKSHEKNSENHHAEFFPKLRTRKLFQHVLEHKSLPFFEFMGKSVKHSMQSLPDF